VTRHRTGNSSPLVLRAHCSSPAWLLLGYAVADDKYLRMTAWCHIPEDSARHCHCCENLELESPHVTQELACQSVNASSIQTSRTGASKRALRWYSKCVKKTFTIKGVQISIIQGVSLYAFKYKHFRSTRHRATFGIPCIVSGSRIEP
jgi:hypothetical protein